MRKISKIFLLLLIVLTLSALFAITAFAEENAAEEPQIPEGSAIEYTDAEGTVSYHTADEFSSLVTAGGTLKLLADIDTDCAAIPVKKDTKIDLNGYTLKRVVYFGKFYEATANGDGSYTYGETAVTTTVGESTRDFFTIQADNISFTITSTNGKGTIYNVNAGADTWTCDDKVVKRTITSYYNSNLILSSYVNDKYYGANIDYELSNVNLYMKSILYQTHRTSGYFDFTIHNVFHFLMNYTKGDDYGAGHVFMIASGININIHVTDSIFYSPNASTSFFRFVDPTYGQSFANVKFTNCDIVKPATSYSLGITNARADSSLILFENCRIYDVNGSSAKSTYGSKGTMMPVAGDASYTPAYDVEGYTAVELSKQKTVSYVVPNTTTFTTDTSSDIQVPNTEYATKTVKLNFKKIITKDVNVTWKKGDEVLRVDTLKPGVDSLASAPALDPYYLEDDDYRNLAYQWADAPENGKAASTELGWEDATYYAVLEIDGHKEYVKGLKGAMLNMSYMAHFAYNFYLPVVDGVEITSVKAGNTTKARGSNIWIANREYYYYTVGYSMSTSALNDTIITVDYTIDGVSYTAKCQFNVMTYAELAIRHERATENEKEAVACLIRYVEESYKYYAAAESSTHYTDNAAKFEEFYTNYRRPADYVTEYPSNEIHTVDEELLKNYIEKIEFKVIGEKVTFAVTLTDEAVAAGYRILFGNVGYKDKISSDGKVYYTDNRTLHGNLMNAKYSITVTDDKYNTLKIDSDGDGTLDKSVMTYYSMATYISIMESRDVNVDLAKSLYAFGKAVIAVRAEIYK